MMNGVRDRSAGAEILIRVVQEWAEYAKEPAYGREIPGNNVKGTGELARVRCIRGSILTVRYFSFFPIFSDEIFSEPDFVHLISNVTETVPNMADDSDPSAPCIGIRFANGQQWRFRPTDTGSAEAIRRMADVMRLSPASTGTELFVTVRWPRGDEWRARVPGQNPPICILPPRTNDAMQIIQMTDLATMIASETLPCGGLLIHGALVERDGSSVILAASGGTGKTTASNRIPLPWRPLSDDATLVVRDGHGNYFAHPWPTWSRFFDNGPGGSWEVERGVPLAAVFFLSQSQNDHAEPLNAGEAAACLLESVHQVMGAPERRGCTRSESLCGMELAAVSALVKAIPVYLLHISLTGRFWAEIDTVLAQRKGSVCADIGERTSSPPPAFHRGEFPDPAITMFGAGHIPIVYSGPSMNPVLGAPDLLDVVPYQGKQPAVGDIICFTLPGDEKNVVHRIIRISGSGIQTQGDNNPSADPDLIQEGQIKGLIIGAIRGNHYQKIAHGTLGRFTRFRMRIRRFAFTLLFRIFRLAKPVLVLTPAITHILPGRWKPRIVLFSSRNNRIMRLFFGASVAGEFNAKRGTWTIWFPFRLLVNETALPSIERPEPGHLQNNALKPMH
jgi:SynChlorMet cassette protein ScmC